MDEGRIYNFIAKCRGFANALDKHWLRNYENFSSEDTNVLFTLEHDVRKIANRVERASGIMRKGKQEKWKGED